MFISLNSMSVETKYIELETGGNAEAVDITPHLRKRLAETGLTDGVATVFVPGSTGGLTTIEFEPGLVEDLKELWERIAPAGRPYHHDRAWGDGNGHSHIRASIVGPSLSIPFCAGEFTLGTWQQVVFLDFDNRARSRRLILQFCGEREST